MGVLLESGVNILTCDLYLYTIQLFEFISISVGQVKYSVINKTMQGTFNPGVQKHHLLKHFVIPPQTFVVLQ